MKEEEGRLKLTMLGYTAGEIDELIRIEKIRMKAENERRKEAAGREIIRKMELWQ